MGKQSKYLNALWFGTIGRKGIDLDKSWEVVIGPRASGKSNWVGKGNLQKNEFTILSKNVIYAIIMLNS